MTKLSNEKALTHLDGLMNKVSIAKEAAALEDAEKNGVIPGTPAGTEEIPVTKDASPCNKEEVPTAEGQFAAEKHTDLKDSTDGDEVEDMADNSDGSAAVVSTDFGAGSIDKESGETKMNEQKRIESLGAKISKKLEKKAAEASPAEAFEKLSAEDKEAVVAFQTVADAHYSDYMTSFAAGMHKKAEDIEAVMDAKGVSEEEAADTLEEIATEDPSLVIPEGPAEEMGDMDPEDVAMLEELANELEAAGVTPEELAEIVAEVEAEGGEVMPEGGEVMPEGGEVMPEMAPEEVEKLASDRHEAIKDLVRRFRG